MNASGNFSYVQPENCPTVAGYLLVRCVVDRHVLIDSQSFARFYLKRNLDCRLQQNYQIVARRGNFSESSAAFAFTAMKGRTQ